MIWPCSLDKSCFWSDTMAIKTQTFPVFNALQYIDFTLFVECYPIFWPRLSICPYSKVSAPKHIKAYLVFYWGR